MQGFPQEPFRLRPALPPEKPPRGPLLTVLLALITLGSLLGIGGTLVVFKAIKRVAATQMDGGYRLTHGKSLFLLLMVAAVLELVCAVGMWMWKRWGVVGYVSMGLLQLAVMSKILPHQQVTYSELVWIALVLAAALPKWNHFD